MNPKFFTPNQLFLMRHCVSNEILIETQNQARDFKLNILNSQMQALEFPSHGGQVIDLYEIATAVEGEIDREKLRLEMNIDDHHDISAIHEYSADLHNLLAKLERMLAVI